MIPRWATIGGRTLERIYKDFFNLLRNRLARKIETYVEVSSEREDSNLFNDNHRNIQGNQNRFFNKRSTNIYGPDILYMTS